MTTISPQQATRIRGSHAILAAVIAISLIIQLILVFQGGTDSNTGNTYDTVAEALWRLFSFFTIASNVVVLVVSIQLVRRPDRDSVAWQALRASSLLSMVITGLVFAIVLAPKLHLVGWAFVATVGFHYIAPWLTLLLWLLFGPRPRFSDKALALAFIWPVLWLVYTFVVGALTDWYPYPFMNVTQIGYGSALLNSFLVLVLAVVLAFLLRWADRKLPVVR